jgi:GNAT superfamily N-acetyltransferase
MVSSIPADARSILAVLPGLFLSDSSQALYVSLARDFGNVARPDLGRRRAEVYGSPVPSVSELLAAYDAQVRARVPDPLPVGVSVDWDGPLLRFLGLPGRGFVLYRDLGGLDGADLDGLIARQIHAFAERSERFEWKLHGHDAPADLPQRLLAAGFVPEDTETIVIAPVAEIAAETWLPEGVSLREVTGRADFERIAALEHAAWGDKEEHSWLVDMLESERAVDPDALTVVVAEAGETVVCAAWIRFERGTEFTTLWGGATRPEWRRRGIYRATVAYRANLAAARGFHYLETDASDDSRPILQRLGFTAVTTTTPYIWSQRTVPTPEP